MQQPQWGGSFYWLYFLQWQQGGGETWRRMMRRNHPQLPCHDDSVGSYFFGFIFLQWQQGGGETWRRRWRWMHWKATILFNPHLPYQLQLEMCLWRQSACHLAEAGSGGVQAIHNWSIVWTLGEYLVFFWGTHVDFWKRKHVSVFYTCFFWKRKLVSVSVLVFFLTETGFRFHFIFFGNGNLFPFPFLGGTPTLISIFIHSVKNILPQSNSHSHCLFICCIR